VSAPPLAEGWHGFSARGQNVADAIQTRELNQVPTRAEISIENSRHRNLPRCILKHAEEQLESVDDAAITKITSNTTTGGEK
jgi:hypothetical protein